MVANKTNIHVFGHWEEAGAHANVQHANSMLLGDSLDQTAPPLHQYIAP